MPVITASSCDVASDGGPCETCRASILDLTFRMLESSAPYVTQVEVDPDTGDATLIALVDADRFRARNGPESLPAAIKEAAEGGR